MPPRTRCGCESTLSVVNAVAAAEAAVELAEIDIEIFGLRGPVAGDHEFEAAADGPAGIGFVVAGEAGLARRGCRRPPGRRSRRAGSGRPQ